MWNNTLTKKNPAAPDYKCRDRSCDGVIWPPRNAARPAAQVKQAYSAGGPLPYEEAPADALPHEKLDHLFRVYALIEDHVLATSVPKFTKADVGTTPESVAAQIATLLIAAQKVGV